jgi:hypothetical protein
MKQETYNVLLRMPIELGKTIFDMATDPKRPIPMNSQIVLLLEYAIREKNRKRKKDTAQHNPTDTR